MLESKTRQAKGTKAAAERKTRKLWKYGYRRQPRNDCGLLRTPRDQQTASVPTVKATGPVLRWLSAEDYLISTTNRSISAAICSGTSSGERCPVASRTVIRDAGTYGKRFV